MSARMSKHLLRGVVVVSAMALALPLPEAVAQPKPVPVAQAEAMDFSTAQLDALLAPIALYPDELFTQILMASTFPLQVVGAARWLDKDENKRLKGDALVKVLEKENWDPSVKSLMPFPQVVATLSGNLEWTQQLGYAVANQQAAVLDAILYRASGIMAFMANQDGIVFQKDLGPRTGVIASTANAFDLDISWAKVEVVD
jgi:hypothetical protein